MALDNRDPERLGAALLAARLLRPELRLSEIAERVDYGALGDIFIHPSVLNGRSHLRVPPDVVRD